ncbi:hypothetical protein Landi51_01908 [Colletotrichum acutatum]
MLPAADTNMLPPNGIRGTERHGKVAGDELEFVLKWDKLPAFEFSACADPDIRNEVRFGESGGGRIDDDRSAPLCL